MTNCLACTKSGKDCPENCLMAKHINSVEIMETVEGHFGSIANFIRLVEAGAFNPEKAAQTLLLEATCRKSAPGLGVLGVARTAVAHLKTAYLASRQPATSPPAKKPRPDEGSTSNTDAGHAELLASIAALNGVSVEEMSGFDLLPDEKEIWDIIYEDNPSLRIPNQENPNQQ
ncbi:uncharacterized protein LOC113317667 [Papaver somniferum]|nr:uncharacterized protein LOC113317667 [Papaver somniferum]